MNLIKSTNPKLKMTSKEVDIPNGRLIGKNVLQFLLKTRNGVGLSAVQVGLLKRVFVMKWGEVFIVINPEITKYSFKKVSMVEGCLSFPNKEVSVKRSQWIEVTYTNGSGDSVATKLEGMVARIFQHEYDHLNGVCKVGDGKQIKTKKENNNDS